MVSTRMKGLVVHRAFQVYGGESVGNDNNKGHVIDMVSWKAQRAAQPVSPAA